eukprot:9352776-Pyramimonas_sp.AAC.1
MYCAAYCTRHWTLTGGYHPKALGSRQVSHSRGLLRGARTSSSSTRDWGVSAPRTPVSRRMCPPKVERLCSNDCPSPMSTRTRSNHSWSHHTLCHCEDTFPEFEEHKLNVIGTCDMLRIAFLPF